MSKQETFEEAFERLEQILEKMNGQQVSLDAALALYEEADRLIISCQKQLADAEQKIEILLKNRESGIALDENNHPQVEFFNPSKPSVLK